MISEHRLKGEQLLALKRRLGKAGWTVFAAEAATTEKGGCSGGTAVIVKQHLAPKPAAEALER